MQFAADANLAAALKEGQKRYLGVRLMVDWARNGLYTDALSDLSAFVDEWDLDRQYSGVVPAELETTEGYSTAKITIKLSGKYDDGAGNVTPLWKIFSPYGGFGTYGTGGAVNTPMYLQVVVRSPLGVWNVDQFTGWIDSATPARASGVVTMVCLDGGGQLESGQTLHRWAADAYRRESLFDSAATNGGEAGEAGTISACWLIDSMLRRSGFYEGPPWHPLATCAWTMRGSALPEIGGWNQITQWNFTNVWSFGMINSTPHLGPAMQTPGEVYSKTKGLYGPAYKDRYSLGNWKATGNRYLTKLTSGAQASTWLGYDQFGSNNSNVLGFAGWFYFDSAEASDPWTVSQFFLSAYHQNFSGSDQYPANMTVTAKGKTRTVVMEINNEGATKNWKWTTNVATNGWHYFSGAVTITPTGVLGSTWLDGVQQFNQTNGGLASTLGTLTYQWIEGATNTVLLNCEGTCQYLQWIGAWNTTFASYQQPASTPPTTPRNQAKVDLAGQRILWFPDIDQDAAGDIIQKVVAADLGAFYFTEQGVATFDSRATIKARQLPANSVFDITIDTATDLAPVSAYVSVANRIGYTAAVKLAEPYRTAYEASKADQFLTQPGQAPRYNVSLTDVQAFWNGSIPPQTYPQGYDPLLSPPTLYWQQYMQYYTPSYYNNGLCLYVPGTRPSNGPPPVGTGMFAYALPGWFNVDTNNRHMRIAIGGSFTSATELAVDDSTAFFKVGGTVITPRPTVTESISDATSIARYRERVFNLGADDWHQDILWLRTLGASLLADTKNPTTQFEDIEVVGDPRRQLQDVCRIIDQDQPGRPGMTGSSQAYGSVTGIKRKYQRDGDGAKLVDTLTIRTFA